MGKSLDSLFNEQRKKSVCVVDKARCIAEYLGGRHSDVSDPSMTLDELTFNGDNFFIQYSKITESENYLSNEITSVRTLTRIKYNGNLVYWTSEAEIGFIASYLPGDWEIEFEKLYEKVQKNKDEIKKFGL